MTLKKKESIAMTAFLKKMKGPAPDLILSMKTAVAQRQSIASHHL